MTPSKSSNGKDWLKIVGLILVILIPLVGVVFGMTKGMIDRNVGDIQTLSIKTDSTDKTATRVEERIIYMQRDLDELKAAIHRLDEKLSDCAGCQ